MQKRWRLAALCGGTILMLATVAWWFGTSKRVLPPEYAGELKWAGLRGGWSQVRTSLDQKILYAASTEGTVVGWDWTTPQAIPFDPTEIADRQRKPVKQSGSGYNPSLQPVVELAESDDGLLIASGLQGALRAWQLPDRKPVKLVAPEVTVTAIVFRRVDNERSVILGLADGRLATLSGQQLTLRKSGHRGIKSLLLSSDQNTLISAGTEGKLIWYHLKNDRHLNSINAHRTEIAALQSLTDEQFASADWDGSLKIWSITQQKLLSESHQPGGISSLAAMKDRLITGNWDGIISLWKLDETDLTLEKTIETSRPVWGIAGFASEALIVSVSGSQSIELWRTE